MTSKRTLVGVWSLSVLLSITACVHSPAQEGVSALPTADWDSRAALEWIEGNPEVLRRINSSPLVIVGELVEVRRVSPQRIQATYRVEETLKVELPMGDITLSYVFGDEPGKGASDAGQRVVQEMWRVGERYVVYAGFAISAEAESSRGPIELRLAAAPLPATEPVIARAHVMKYWEDPQPEPGAETRWGRKW